MNHSSPVLEAEQYTINQIEPLMRMERQIVRDAGYHVYDQTCEALHGLIASAHPSKIKTCHLKLRYELYQSRYSYRFQAQENGFVNDLTWSVMQADEASVWAQRMSAQRATELLEEQMDYAFHQHSSPPWISMQWGEAIQEFIVRTLQALYNCPVEVIQIPLSSTGHLTALTIKTRHLTHRLGLHTHVPHTHR